MTGWSEKRYYKKKATSSDSSCAVHLMDHGNDKKYYADETVGSKWRDGFYKTDIGIMPTRRAEKFSWLDLCG